jgi:hypothetical protein
MPPGPLHPLDSSIQPFLQLWHCEVSIPSTGYVTYTWTLTHPCGKTRPQSSHWQTRGQPLPPPNPTCLLFPQRENSAQRVSHSHSMVCVGLRRPGDRPADVQMTGRKSPLPKRSILSQLLVSSKEPLPALSREHDGRLDSRTVCLGSFPTVGVF